jgi:Ni/Co efflux regulator RcnB
MRKFLITLLMASAAATPAIAAGPRHDSSDRQQAREERQQAREERAAPAPRAAPAERQERAERPQFQPSANRAERPQVEQRTQRVERPQFEPRERSGQAFQAPAQIGRDLDSARAENARREANTARTERFQDRTQTIQQLRDSRVQAREQRVDAREARQAERAPMTRSRPPVVSNVPRPGTQPPAPVQTQNYRPSHQTQWNTSWRNNHRYDWPSHRRHHRSQFHLGFYIDPYGWGYQPFSIGWRLWPSYYSRNYWITDPWMYRLPYAPAGYVWIRYWNDALLVDTWSGQVVDMIPNFFW